MTWTLTGLTLMRGAAEVTAIPKARKAGRMVEKEGKSMLKLSEWRRREES